MAVELYKKGAYYALVPRVLSAENLPEVLKTFLNDDDEDVMNSKC